MKRIVLIITALFLMLGVQAQKTYVTLVGISNYGGPEDANLYNTTNDVKKMKAIFEKQGAMVGAITSRYATTENINKRLDALVKVAGPDDKIIFFFSGHGTTGGFITYGLHLFTYTELYKKLSQSKAKSIVCIFDACGSGSVQGTFAQNYDWFKENRNIAFMMGCRADEYSYENQWVGQGFFTKALSKGLRGLADANGDKKVTLEELFKYVYTDVVKRSKDAEATGLKVQHPQYIGSRSMLSTVITKW